MLLLTLYLIQAATATVSTSLQQCKTLPTVSRTGCCTFFITLFSLQLLHAMPVHLLWDCCLQLLAQLQYATYSIFFFFMRMYKMKCFFALSWLVFYCFVPLPFFSPVRKACIKMLVVVVVAGRSLFHCSYKTRSCRDEGDMPQRQCDIRLWTARRHNWHLMHKTKQLDTHRKK